jgi:hypothetical protein
VKRRSPMNALSIRRTPVREVLSRLEGGGARLLSSGSDAPSVASTNIPTVEDRLNAEIGCKTSEVALALLAQVLALENEDLDTASESRIDALVMQATAMLAELEPTTAAEAMLAAQMVGTQRVSMTFLASATKPGQTVEGADRHVQRAMRLGRLFIEQLDAMAKLKGKGGQQRVVVEHVTVSAGGQAIVGAVTGGGERGASDADQR